MNVTGFGAVPVGGGVGTYTVTRGFAGTTAAAHAVGKTVTLVTPAPVASFSCNGTATITSTLAGAGFGPADISLKVTMLPGNTTGTIATQAATTATLASPAVCPSTTTKIVIGEPSGGTPGNSAMALLGATINLNPALVATQDDCGTPPLGGTFDGFGVVAKWEDPGFYGAGVVLGSPPPTSIGQVLFPTSVLSFAGYVIAQPTGDATQAGGHYDFVFPSLPTSLALCPGTPNSDHASRFQPTILTATKSPPTGGGNPSSPTVRGDRASGRHVRPEGRAEERCRPRHSDARAGGLPDRRRQQPRGDGLRVWRRLRPSRIPVLRPGLARRPSREQNPVRGGAGRLAPPSVQRSLGPNSCPTPAFRPAR